MKTQDVVFEPSIPNGRVVLKRLNVCFAVEQTPPYRVLFNGMILGVGSLVSLNIPVVFSNGEMKVARIELSDPYEIAPRP